MKTPTHTSILPTSYREFRNRLRQARLDLQAQRAMRAELAHFTTEAERLELSEVLRRHSPESAAQVRSLLDS